jgi:hypothetical protein
MIKVYENGDEDDDGEDEKDQKNKIKCWWFIIR